MEATQGIVSSGITFRGGEAPDSFRLAPRAENSNSNSNPNPVPNSINFGSPPLPGSGSIFPGGVGGTEGKKKRGRPRKYRPDGSLSPMPISASIPLTGGDLPSFKKTVKRQPKIEYRNHPGEGAAAFSMGANFTPHVLTVNAGEDVTMKVMTFSQRSDRAVCILSANGTISNVTLRQPTSSGGTLTYEGRFEILSLSGSFILTENGGTKSRTGGMSVSLAGPDGRVVGGGLAGLFIAAGPVQVVVGSFLPSPHMEIQKKQRIEHTPPQPISTPAPVTVLTAEELKVAYAAAKPAVINPPPHHPSPFHHNHPPSFNMFMNPSSDNKSSSSAEEEDDDSRGHQHSTTPPYEVSC